MAGLGGVDEVSLRTGRRHRRRDLPRHMPRLADASADHPALGRQNRIDRPDKSIIKTGGEKGQGFGLKCEDAACCRDMRMLWHAAHLTQFYANVICPLRVCRVSARKR